jgi:hypothetical protein
MESKLLYTPFDSCLCIGHPCSWIAQALDFWLDRIGRCKGPPTVFSRNAHLYMQYMQEAGSTFVLIESRRLRKVQPDMQNMQKSLKTFTS